MQNKMLFFSCQSSRIFHSAQKKGDFLAHEKHDTWWPYVQSLQKKCNIFARFENYSYLCNYETKS